MSSDEIHNAEVEEGTYAPSIPVGVHESDDWNKDEAVNLLMCAAIYYIGGVKNSSLAATEEAISNAPTWYFASVAPTPLILGSAVAGSALVAAIASETIIKTLRLNRVLGLIEKLHNAEDPIKAVEDLENDMHKEGMLFEHIPQYDLADYPEEKINSLIENRTKFIDIDSLAARIKNTSNALRAFPVATVINAAITTPNKLFKAAKAVPHYLDTAGTNLTKEKLLNISSNLEDATITLAKGSATLGKTLLIGLFTNILKPSNYKSIANGTKGLVNIVKHFSIKTGESRFAVKQKPFLTEVKKHAGNSELSQANVADEFLKEQQIGEADLRSTVREAQFEAGKLAAEKIFLGCYAVGLADNLYQGSNLGNSFNESSIGFDDGSTAGLALFSIAMAWGPYAHMAKRTDELYEVATGQRATQIEEYGKMGKFLKALKEQRESLSENETIAHENEPEENTPS